MTDAPQTQQEAEEIVTPGNFGLREGTTVEVLTMENRLTFVGKVENFRNGAVMLREAKGDELPPVMYNREVKLRFFGGKGNVVLCGKVCGSTNLIWKVDSLESKFTKEQRAFFRQRISPHTEGRCSRRAFSGVKATKPVVCQVLDISAGGMLIACEDVYEEGNRLAVTGVCLVKSEDPFSFTCRVRRAGGRLDTGLIRYGCQFETLTPREQDRLLRAIFAVQREELHNQKEREGL